MLRHLFPFTVSQLSNLDLTLALVVSLLVTTAQANTSLGSDAPAPETESQPSNTAASTSGSGGLSRTAKIVIGVVVGMVGISAISGAVFFFFRKKKKQNKKTKRHETISTYHDAKRAGYRQYQMPFRRQWQPDPEQGMIEIAKIERDSRTVRDSVLPKYDPSSFHRDHYSIDSSRGAMSLDIPREPLLSYHHQHNRNSLSFSKVMAPIPLPPPPPPPLPSMPSAAEWNRRSATEANNSIWPKASTNKDSSAPAVPVSTSSQERPKGPKKPKPTLARLITNL